MGKRKSGSHDTRQRMYRLKINYEDINHRHLGEFHGDYTPNEPVRVPEKLFISNGTMLRAAEIVMKMPRHAVEKTVVCRKCSTKRKPTSRHDV